MAAVGLPAILKTRQLGYDGHGQARIDREEDVEVAIAATGGASSVLEAVVPFRREVSVIAARGLDGTVVAYDPGENEHEAGILRRTVVPARLSGGARAGRRADRRAHPERARACGRDRGGAVRGRRVWW